MLFAKLYLRIGALQIVEEVHDRSVGPMMTFVVEVHQECLSDNIFVVKELYRGDAGPMTVLVLEDITV